MDLFLEGVFQYCFQGGQEQLIPSEILSHRGMILGDYFEIRAFTAIME